ncbi:MAG: biosynthetic-type acetolactate synthase large subunit [Candidatus Marinimicrobia bacterium]|jgi:acetolactate synthase-1/2/3 large subunit|nr:acetolactate synthase, large subunit, biosynthetic type [Candidatus Neomarinimicrobiota bacterium]MDP6457605.1 biosynthetic-type acetolactate synthase large subunit [Candidatus Neomarinimicrobiota bacterium]MDP6593149.1 biosynthetic-type acetolactate synthase large subunit [Candidatus Neomarinimicrobiota bacterium]MDP6836981.1 biosynthetic-type acetolactate synthase large subunit [Candidatus Neomarinimicrobiota bacterium]|tara:strand:+ start:2841 stop:4589 length:1749 start_codon:yes stop_codon:yes gene_type:complete
MNEKSQRLTGAEIIWECLICEDVNVVFGYPGGAILPTYDALNKYRDQVHHVLVRHEQGATHMADGYARASGKVGVAMATSGPGATNMITGMATAMLDSSPIVCITGQVTTGVIGSDAFQETDITGAAIPVTKHSYLVMDVEELAATIREAFFVARSGRPGPVLIDIPKDVQNAVAQFVYPDDPIDLPGYHPPKETSHEYVEQFIQMVDGAEKPLIFAGHGVLLSNACKEVMNLAQRASIPIATTLLGIGGVPDSHPLVLGMMGMHGEAWVNKAVQDADLLIACGMRFDDRVTGNLRTYSPNSKKIHIEIDASEINKNIQVDLAVNADLATVLRQVTPGIVKRERTEWLKTISQWHQESQLRDVQSIKSDSLLGAQAIRHIWEGTNGEALIVSDVGQHQMLEAQYYEHNDPRTLITSGGLGTMGFSLPAAIGASFHEREREIWVVVGDGSIQMTIMELATAVQENVNINIAIINNGYLGMVRQWQQMFYEARYAETPITSPDYMKLAEAYGLSGYRVDKLDDVIPTMEKAQHQEGPTLIEFVVEQHDMVYPMVPAGADLHDMITRPHPLFTGNGEKREKERIT